MRLKLKLRSYTTRIGRISEQEELKF